MTCLLMGWNGDQGAWVGYNTWSNSIPLAYYKGCGFSNALRPTMSALPEGQGQKNIVGSTYSATKAGTIV